MKKLMKRMSASAFALLALSAASAAFAHSGGGTIDPAGNNANAVDLAAVTCYDDGNGPAAFLEAQVKDMSAPVANLFLSLQIFKSNKMVSTTDNTPGDANYSSAIRLNAGNGVYYLSLTKTKKGLRLFDVVWHCKTATNGHTGTDIAVVQFQ